ncbi:MAG TPA: hypothetical protein VKI65_16350, partial [Gemmataceae bacterium]|nr:hypothetical protein [Gemmataceae bacterium]
MQTTSIAGLRTGSGIIPTWGRRRSAFLLPLLLASTWLMLPPASARGQPADKQVKIFFSEIANDPNPTITSLRLRPNTPQQAYLYVRNNTAKPIKAFLEVRAGGIEGTIVPGSRIPIELKGNGLTSVVLPNPPPPPPGGKPAPPPAWRAPLLVRVLGEKNEPLGEDAEILVRRASDYVEVSKVEFDPSPKDGKENRLTVEVLAADTFSGPECHVELVLRPDRIPALLPGQKKEGTYEGSLSKPGDRLRLVAENLQFADKAKHTGQVYLTIDGYERALLYRATFEAKGSPSSPARITRSVVRLQPVAAATPSDKTRIGLEIDNVRAGETAEFGFDRDNDGAFQPTELTILPGDRRQEIILGPSGPDGAIQFKAVVSDWNPELKTTGIFGKRKLRVRVLDKDQKAIPFLDAATDDLTLQEDGYAITST